MLSLFEEMETIVNKEVLYYKEDFYKYDKQILLSNGCKKYLWGLRDCGTFLIDLSNVYFLDSDENQLIKHYKTYIKKLYIIEIQRIDNDNILGKITKINANKFYEELKNKEQQCDYVIITLNTNDGKKYENLMVDFTENYINKILYNLNIEKEDISKIQVIDYLPKGSKKMHYKYLY